MFATERRNAIRRALYRQKKVDVSQMSEMLGVSEVTIRKDLEYLEKEGLLIRTHGGAVLRESASLQENLISTNEPVIERFRSISNTIACLLEDGDMIYLGAGLLCLAIAKTMKTRKFLTVVTNNLSAATVLSENPGIRVICTQGTIYREQDVCTIKGTETLQYLSTLSYDKLIIGVDSFKVSRGFSMQDGDLAQLYKSLVKNSDQRIIAATSDCFDRNAPYPFGDFDVATTLVSDEQLSEDAIRFFYDRNIKVFTTYDLEKIG